MPMLGILLFCLAILLVWWALSLYNDCEAVSLNLTVEGPTMASVPIGTRVRATIAPKNIKEEFAPVTGLDYSENTDAYDLESFDGSVAVFIAVKPGAGAVVTASAFSKSLVQLFDSVALADVEAPPVDEEAVTLGLTVEYI